MTPKLKTSKTKLEIQKAVVRKSFLVSLITFVIVLIIVFFCWRYAVAGVRFRQRIKFEAFSKEMSTLIVSRIQSYIEVLYGAQRFFAASKEVERSEWRLFVNPENLRERFPAIRAMRFIKRVQAEDLSNFVNQVKNDTSIYPEGYPQFQIKDLSEEGGVLNVKSEVFVVTYVEPYEGNEKMLGMDVSSDQFRWKSYEQAWVTGEPAIAKIIEITSKKSAFAVCSPIYQQGAPLFSVQEKKKAHIGFVDIIFQTQYFFKSIFGKNQIFDQIQYEVFDGEVKDPNSAPQKLIFQSWDPSETESYRKSFFRNDYRIMVPGSDWTLFFYASKDFAAQEIGQEIPELVLLGGFLLGFLIWAVLYVLSTSRFQAVTLAQNITQDLRESEQKFKAITQSATDAIISIDSQGFIIFWNEGAERAFGYKEQEILKKNVSILMPIRYQEAHKAGLNRFLKTQEAHLIGKTVEVHGIRKDGTEFPIEVSLANWQHEEKQFFTAILRDISERKKNEQELQLNRDRYAKLLQEAPDPIITFDEFGILKTANLAAEKACGYLESELAGKNISQVSFISEPSKEKMANEFSLLVSKKERFPYEIEAIAADGTHKFFEVNPRLILTNEKIEAIQLILRDLSERKKAQKREAIEHYIVKILAISETVDEALTHIVQLICKQFNWELGSFWRVEPDTNGNKLLRCSAVLNFDKKLEVREKTCLIGSGLVGRAWESNDLVWLSNMPSDSHILDRSQESKISFQSTLLFPFGDEEVAGMLEFCATQFPPRDPSLITMFRTIGNQIGQFIQQKSMEAQLFEAKQTLADREKSDIIAQLAAGVAHEVKNPLTILLQGTDYLKTNGKLKNTDDIEVVNLMANAIDRADRIIKGLLELSRPDTLNVRPEDIHTIIDTSLLLVKNQFDRRSIVVQKQFSRSIPKVDMDRGKIEQVFINLFSNAIDAMGEAGELIVRTKLSQIRKDSESAKEQKGLVVEIEDTGPGVSEGLLTKIFTPFVTSKRAKGGSGLGLPIVRNIMEMHKGWVQIENVKGRGAKVSLIFPI